MRLAGERRAAILRTAQLRGSIRVAAIAKTLGVSTVTVRRDLNALADEGLLERVHGGATLRRQAEDQTRRRPYRATIGLVLPSSRYYYSSVIRGAEAAAADHAVRLVLAITNYQHEEDWRQVRRLLDLGVEGLLISTSKPPDIDSSYADWLAAIPVPVVLVERRVDLPGAATIGDVRTDHAAGARVAIRHLAALGHKTVALAVRHGSPTTRWLIDGHRGAVRDGVIAPSPEMALLQSPGSAVVDAAMGELLDRCAAMGTRAVLVHTDVDAAALARLAVARGLQVPGDLAIVAYDDEVASLAEVPLTAVAPPKYDVGRLALDHLMRRLTAAPDDPPQHVTLMPGLVVRASCRAG